MNSLGSVFKQLRKARGMRQIEMAEALQEHGVCITTKTGVSHLEKRGTQKHNVLVAYENIFQIKIESMVNKASAFDHAKT